METPEDRVYSRQHEWTLKKNGRVVVGITDHAQDQLGDVVFVELPEIGENVTAGKPMGEAESTKTLSEIYSPVTGRVVERNDEVKQNPELLNQDPYGRGWLVVIELSEEPAGLMMAEDYLRFIEESESGSGKESQ